MEKSESGWFEGLVQLSINQLIMNPIETKKIKEVMELWTNRAIEDDHYPVLLITMSGPKEMRIERGGEYTNAQIRGFLMGLIDNLGE